MSSRDPQRNRPPAFLSFACGAAFQHHRAVQRPGPRIRGSEERGELCDDMKCELNTNLLRATSAFFFSFLFSITPCLQRMSASASVETCQVYFVIQTVSQLITIKTSSVLVSQSSKLFVSSWMCGYLL